MFVVCVDRDNDLGRKTKVVGPVIGRERNIEAAQKLILADPEESDANTMFAAVRKLNEAEKEFKNVEIITLTGAGKTGLNSDKEINRQLDELTKNYIVEGWILVTDGMEDSQVIPLLQSRAKIISTEQVIIKQAQAVESTFYTLKEVFKDPGVARLFLGVPGLMLLAYFFLGAYSIQAMALIAGAYLLLKGFGIEEKIFGFFNILTASIMEQRASVVFYFAALLMPFLGLWLAYIQIMSSEFIDVAVDITSAARTLYPFIMIAALLIIAGKAIDSVYNKKSYNLGKYLIQAASVVSVWAILDAGTLVFLRQADLAWFPANIMFSLVIIIVAMRASKVFDVKGKVTRVLIGLSAMDEEGNYLGKVVEVDKKKQSIFIQGEHKRTEKQKKQFAIKNGRIVVAA